MTEINSLAPLLPSGAAGAKPAASGEVLRLTQPQGELLPPGTTAQADVLSVRQAGQDFQMLLRLTLANGNQANVQATASQPLPPGSQVTVSQPYSSQLALLSQSLGSDKLAALTRLDSRDTPPGTLLQGKVLTTQALPQVAGQAAVYRSLVSLLNTPQAGATLSIDSPRPLAVGSLLSARVEGDQSLRFVPLSGRQEQLAVTQQLLSQQGRQASLTGVLDALLRLPSDTTSSELRSAAERLLAGLPDIRQLGDAKAVAQALSNSGSFFEARLIAGQPVATDLKANLLQLVGHTSLATGNAPFNPASSALAATLPALPGLARAALGMLGNAAPRNPSGGFPLPARLLQGLAGEGDVQQLLRLAAAAIARLQSHQLGSLQQSGIDQNGNLQTTWQTELALRSGQEFVPVQVKLQRQDASEPDSERAPAARETPEPLWRIELAFDLHPLGPLQVLAQLSQGQLSGQLWAERPATAQLLDSQLDALRERLLDRGLQVGELASHPGTPPLGPRTRLEQRWVDENA
ncbi:flagellar hook-length control protein FliK [Pseudomonas cremoricolorata]|uniref:Flagellar hook-length control protein FliK n=1 Tax=Pseudomonas cremoricolorata TaxID=157783 RepID=A0A089WLE6_9PSED|nr:flagellar hook-length control protein FliK [Pseudomonas cremoricolorata]AIR90105.1 flagellar hook-length control protein FliK [Pseudomonas cremoricolorata]